MTPNHSLPKKDVHRRLIVSGLVFLVSLVVLAIKFWAFDITNSQAIYSDALETIVNVLTAILGMVVIYYAAMPVDEDHPYGHGKVEYFSSAFEGGLITFAAIAVFVEAIKAQLKGEALQELNTGLLLILIASIINLILGLLVMGVGRKQASLALQATGTHLIMDFWTTVGSIIGIALVKWTGEVWIDRVIAMVLGIHMARTGFKLVKQSISGLLDAEDLTILEQLARIFEKHAGAGIIQIHHTKVIRSGWFHHIDAHIVVPEFWSVEQAHERLDVFEDKVIHEYEFSGEANFHLDPCKRRYCAVCDYQNCKVRVAEFESRIPVVLEHLRSKTEPNLKS